MARTNEEWAGLLGSTLSKMALVRETDSPDAYLPQECFVVIEKVFDVALREARGDGYAEAVRDIEQQGKAHPGVGSIRQLMRAVPMLR